MLGLFFFPKESEQQTIDRLTKVLTALQSADISSRWQDLQKSTEFAIIRALEITREVWKEAGFTEEKPPETQSQLAVMWMACDTVAQAMIDDGRLDKTLHIHIDQAAEKAHTAITSPEAKKIAGNAIAVSGLIATKTILNVQSARVETQQKIRKTIHWGYIFLIISIIIIIVASIASGPTNF